MSMYVLAANVVMLWLQITVEMCYMDVNAASSIQEHTLYEFQRWQPVSVGPPAARAIAPACVPWCGDVDSRLSCMELSSACCIS